ncbi:molybdopterin-synthase adenylyltransferase MoeB [Arthrobacter sp. Br18]|uniref:molybdopterin-synthase adenylyltransferase MoeB n=1 Tax=Arthrobacter sp. Br18 TaxID=1312954 RepID=UPI00047E3C68|nr:molybdopterin-synthase adenylyltransferase MoeB [Arthrobacter sp. Br18]
MSVFSASEDTVILPPLVEPAGELTHEEALRYSRHLIIPEFGMVAQRRLKNARVLVIGAGGLGSPVLLYLAAAGVGSLGIVDDDVVELSNLQRQVIHGVGNIGGTKAESARQSLSEVNPLVEVQLFPERLTAGNALEIFAGYDLVVDGTDNFATRYLVNDAAAIRGIPYVWGSILRFDGQVSVFWEKHGPGYRDLYPEAPPPGSVPSCAEGGVLGVLCAQIGSVMANEVIKLITGIGRTLLGRVLVFDALDMSWREVRVRRDPRALPTTELVDYDAFCGLLAADGTAEPVSTVTVDELAVLLGQRAAGGTNFSLLDVREPGEYDVVRIEGAELVPKDRILGGEYSPAADRPVYVHCKAGSRSVDVVRYLAQHGYERVYSVEGGIVEWVHRIEPHKPVY